MRLDVIRRLKELDHNKGFDIKHKARVKLALEGDENSKFFHGIIRKICHKIALMGC